MSDMTEFTEPRDALPAGSEWYAPGGSGTHHDIRVNAEKAALRGKNCQIAHWHAKGEPCPPADEPGACELIDYRDLPEWAGTGMNA